MSYVADLANVDLVTLKLQHNLLGKSMLPLMTWVARADATPLWGWVRTSLCSRAAWLFCVKERLSVGTIEFLSSPDG